MNQATTELRNRNLRTVLALAALFLLPLIASFWLYYGAAWRPSGRTNHGELIDPARPLPGVLLRVKRVTRPASSGAPASTSDAEAPADSTGQRDLRDNLFLGRWSLVYVAPEPCDTDCQRALYVMRQTRLALNNDMTRVQRVWLVTTGCCEDASLVPEHAGLLLADAHTDAAAPLLARLPAEAHATSVFVVDPNGNLMMRYDARRNPRGMLDDLRKLLQLSHIG